jgi:hypothetical protein
VQLITMSVSAFGLVLKSQGGTYRPGDKLAGEVIITIADGAPVNVVGKATKQSNIDKNQ